MLIRAIQVVGIVFGFLLLCLVGLVVMGGITSEVTCVSNLSTGRTVTATATGWSGVGAADTKDSVTLNMSGHTILVAPAQITLDGAPVATIDPSVQSVDVTSDGRRILFVADGKTIAAR